MSNRLTDAEIRARRDALLEAESHNPMGIHWLSFCDPRREPGEQFLGVLVVRERGFTSAVLFAHRMGLNPGGEVAGFELPTDQKLEKVLEGHYNRLLTREESLRLSELVGATLTATEGFK